MMNTETHGIIIPAYNAGPKLRETVDAVLTVWPRIIVVDDASTDGCAESLVPVAGELLVIRREVNGGKGAAVVDGAERARQLGWTHALVMDADGQHPVGQIREFMSASAAQPDALIVGQPVFGSDAPKIRLYGRKLSVGLVKLQTGWHAIEDPLFGFRVYPLVPLLQVMHRTWSARRYDFDPEVAVRLVWAGVPTINLPATCRYLSKAEGGVSHFHYVRDNIRMVTLHTRLLVLWVFCYAWVLAFRRVAPRRRQEQLGT